MSRLSFRRRISVAAAVAVAVAIAFASAIAFVIVRGEMRSQIDDSLRNTANAIGGDRFVFFSNQRASRPPKSAMKGGPIAVEPAGKATAVPAPRPSKRGESSEVLLAPDAKQRLVLPAPPLGGNVRYAQVVEAGGRTTGPPRGKVDLPGSGQARRLARRGRGSFFSNATIRGTKVRIYTKAIQKGAALQVARPVDELDGVLQRLAWVLAAVSLGGIVLAAGLSMLVTRTALKPVADLSAAAEHVAETRDLSRRIDTASHDELGRLATSFNTMLKALEHSMRQQRQLVADASHELRTPLTSLRTNIEVLAASNGMEEGERRHLARSTVAQLEELTALVTDLVDLAREDEAPDQFATDLRLDELVRATAERAQRRHPERPIKITTEPTMVRGVGPRLDRAVANLLDNAEKWSPIGAPIEITVGEGAVTVRDHGPGIADADLPFIFDRFYRAPSARGLPGSGLGLAIVRQVAEAHHGRVTVGQPRGDGATVRIELGSQECNLMGDSPPREPPSSRQPAETKVPRTL